MDNETEIDYSPDIDINGVMRMLPHRYPFLLIDKLVKVRRDHSAVGIKNVTINEQFFQGHFPGNPVMPGVLIIEAMAQAAGLLVMDTMGLTDGGVGVLFTSVDSARFRKPVVPGDQLEIYVEKERNRGNLWRFKGVARVDGIIKAEATYAAMIMEQPCA